MSKKPESKIVRDMRRMIEDIKAGKPFKQTIMRRMIVKGKVVFTRETFTGPVLPIRRGRDDD